MLKKYNDLNAEAKSFITEEIKKIEKDRLKLKRCIDEIDNLYEKKIILIIKWLYIYKNQNTNIKYWFGGTINNFYILYKLGLNNIDSIKYNLAYELCNNICCIEFKILNKDENDFIETVNSMQNDFTICESFSNSNFEENYNQYVIKENTDLKSMANLEYSKNDLPIIVLDKNYYFNELILNIYLQLPEEEQLTWICENLEKEVKRISTIINPTSEEDYTKIPLLAINNFFSKTKQEKLFKDGLINKNQFIASREDIYDYLIKHNIDKDISYAITKYVRQGKVYNDYNSDKWEEYKDIMKKNNCEDWFIDILARINYIYPKSYGVKLYLNGMIKI